MDLTSADDYLSIHILQDYFPAFLADTPHIHNQLHSEERWIEIGARGTTLLISLISGQLRESRSVSGGPRACQWGRGSLLDMLCSPRPTLQGFRVCPTYLRPSYESWKALMGGGGRKGGRRRWPSGPVVTRKGNEVECVICCCTAIPTTYERGRVGWLN